MIIGHVTAQLEPKIGLHIEDSSGQTHYLDAAIDTAFSAYLSLPPLMIANFGLPVDDREIILGDGTTIKVDIHSATIIWDIQPIQPRNVQIHVLSTISILLNFRSTILEPTPYWMGICSAVSALATAVSAIFVGLSYILILRQLDQAALTAKTNILLSLFVNLEEDRKQRQIVFGISDSGRADAIDDADSQRRWSTEELEAANTVAARFHSAGILVSNDLVDANLFLSLAPT